jgi:hypothetical protein
MHATDANFHNAPIRNARQTAALYFLYESQNFSEKLVPESHPQPPLYPIY